MPYFELGYIPKNDWNRGTYRELKAILNELPEHYLDQTATILLSDSDEYTKMDSIGWTGPGCDVLDLTTCFSPLMPEL